MNTTPGPQFSPSRLMFLDIFRLGYLRVDGVARPLFYRIAETDRLIDQVVNRPCGLTAEEIGVVGGAWGTGPAAGYLYFN